MKLSHGLLIGLTVAVLGSGVLANAQYPVQTRTETRQAQSECTGEQKQVRTMARRLLQISQGEKGQQMVRSMQNHRQGNR